MKKIFILTLLVFILSYIIIFARSEINSIKDINVQVENGDVIVNVITDFAPNYKYFSLESDEYPLKVAVDIRNAKVLTSRTIPVKKAPVEKIRISQWFVSPDIVRFVIDLSEKVDYDIESTKDGISIKFASKQPIKPISDTTYAKVTSEKRVADESKKLDKKEFVDLQNKIKKEKPKVIELKDTVKYLAKEIENKPPEIPNKSEMSKSETFQVSTVPKSFAEQKIEMMNYRNISIIDLLRVFSEIYNVNIVISKDVLPEDLVTVRLQNVRLEGALEAILTANGYNFIRKNDIILVKSRATELVGELETEIFQLQYLNGSDVIENLRKIITPDRGKIEMFVRSPIGKVGVALPTLMGSMGAGGGGGMATTTAAPTAGGAGGGTGAERSNVLIVTDYPEIIERIRKIINEIDRPPNQVRIEVKLIESKLDDRDRWGINWTATVEAIGKGGMPSGAQMAGGGAGATATTTAQVTPEGAPGVQVPGKPLNVKNFQFGTLSLSQFKALLEMLEQRGNSKLLNQPSISVIDNQQADIAVGTIIPVEVYQPLLGAGGAGAGGQQQMGMIGGTTVQQQFVSIALTVIPHVNDDKFVTLWIQPSVSEITGYTGKYGDLPVTSTRSANSQVRVKDGDTVIIGGLIKEDKLKTTKRVKFLSRIPLFGNLFIYNTIDSSRSELVIFITPYIIRDENFASQKANVMGEN